MIEFGKDNKICPHEVSLNGRCANCGELSNGNIQLISGLKNSMRYSPRDVINMLPNNFQENRDEFILKFLKLGFKVIKDGHEYELSISKKPREMGYEPDIIDLEEILKIPNYRNNKMVNDYNFGLDLSDDGFIINDKNHRSVLSKSNISLEKTINGVMMLVDYGKKRSYRIEYKVEDYYGYKLDYNTLRRN